MPESKFKSGDIVRLKTGGPKMAVRKNNLIPTGVRTSKQSEELICQWFDGDGEVTPFALQEGIFHPQTLMEAD